MYVCRSFTRNAKLIIVQMRVTLVLIHQKTVMDGEIHVYGITRTTVNGKNAMMCSSPGDRQITT